MRSDTRAVFLVGFMGSGKSAVGRIVARRWGREFADTDAHVEAAQGRSIETIFRTSGEGSFREAEWRVLQVLGTRDRMVIATGGGLFLGVVQRRFMKEHGISVWLDAPLEIVRERVGAGAGRPLWMGDDRQAQRAFFEKRRAAYALADVRVDAGKGDPDEIADRTIARLDRFFH
jgi:shikimate kinase